MQLSIRDVTFAYEGSYQNVFDHLTVNLDTSWRLGLIGRNGRGKTTLLNLLLGRYPCQGQIQLPLRPVYFPFTVEDSSQLSLFVMEQAAPDVEDWQLIRECNLLKVEPDVLYRPFDTLSRGEQTKLLLAALFSRQDVYPLIDEPTNHLDAHGRAIVADYLRRKDGFLLVSHDRAFLNRCIDHVLSLNRSDAWVMQGNYDDWQQRFDRQNQQEADRSQQLKGEISRLEESARQAAVWSAQGEKGKFHTPPSESAVTDRGYIGARSARMMKRSLSTLRRREQAVEEKKSLLHNVERPGGTEADDPVPPQANPDYGEGRSGALWGPHRMRRHRLCHPSGRPGGPDRPQRRGQKQRPENPVRAVRRAHRGNQSGKRAGCFLCAAGNRLFAGRYAGLCSSQRAG